MKNTTPHLPRLGQLLLLLAICVLPLHAEPGHSRNSDLNPNDLIDIKVFQEDDLQSTLRIAGDGTINFPLIGVVHVANGTAQEAAKEIQKRLAKGFLVNPQVTVTVKEFAKRRFTVLGEVQKPGAYDLPDRDAISLLEGIGMAGGYTRIAAPNHITVKRVINGRETIYKLNGKTMASGDGGPAFELCPGDVITVAESIF